MRRGCQAGTVGPTDGSPPEAAPGSPTTRGDQDARGLRAFLGVDGVSTVGGGVSVQCPSSEPVQSGLTFKCLASDSSDGSSVMVDVTVQDSNGDFVWQAEG
jgi:hypothetical protein